MNSTAECEIYIFLGGRLDRTDSNAYAALVFQAILCIITIPFTIVLNALVIAAVKSRPRLRSNSNIVLGSLATTDGIMGLIGQPLYIAEITAILLGETSNVYCSVIRLCQDILRVLGKASVFHVALMNVERYIAIKHSFAHIIMITKARLLKSSAFLWNDCQQYFPRHMHGRYYSLPSHALLRDSSP